MKINGGDVELAVLKPTQQHLREAQKVYNTTFATAIKEDGCILREKLDDVMRSQGLWDDAKESEFKRINQEIHQKERVFAVGGVKKSEAKQVALELKKLRLELRRLLSIRTSLDANTAQGQADNARFNYLVSVCTVYNNDSRRYYKNMDEYLDKADDDVAIQAATLLSNMLYGIDSNYEAKLPENQFLVKFGYVDSKLRLIDDVGRLVDNDGRLIDEEGRFINEEGKYVDVNGELIDKDGNFIVDFKPFLDDDGNPIE